MGIIWGIGGFAEGRFILRHKDKYFLEQMHLPNTIYSQITARGKMQYVLKTKGVTPADIPGWSARNASERNVPILDDYRDFLRAYIELHGCLDYCIAYTREKSKHKYKKLRLRIYGNNILIQSINAILHENCFVGLKSIQKTANDTTKYISYTSYNELLKIFEWIDGYPHYEPFWADVDKKLRQPIIN